jgi:hypothetical protein
MHGSSTQNASEQFVSFIHISLLNFVFYQPHKQKPKGVASWVSNSFTSVTIQNYTHVHINFLSCNVRYCKLQEYWPFLLNHTVYREEKLSTAEAYFLQSVLMLLFTKRISSVFQYYFENCFSNTNGCLLQTFKFNFPPIPYISKWSHSWKIFAILPNPNPIK